MTQIMLAQDTTEAQNIYFVGRENEQHMYARFLTQDTPWVFLITGLPGSGKSTLLRRLKDQTDKRFPVVLLNFAQPWLRTDILTFLEKLAEQLEPYCDTSRLQLFKQKLADYRVLLPESGKRMNQMIDASEQAEREQIQRVVRAGEAHRQQEQVIEDIVESFYVLAETFQPARLVIMLDTSEWLYEPGEVESSEVGKWIMNSFLPVLHQRMQQRGKCCFFVIASRDRLYLGKVNAQDRIEHILPLLKRAEVEQYLHREGMQDAVLCKQVYEVSRGHPFYMMLVAELWHRQKEQPLKYPELLREQQELNAPALLNYLGEWLLDKNLTEPINGLIRYGVLLRNFNLPMLRRVFPEYLSEGNEREQFTQLIAASYILPRGEYYAFHDLMREMLATRIRIHDRKKWRLYHERAWKYLSEITSRHGTCYPVDAYYHALAYNEKIGMEEWQLAATKAYEKGARDALAALFLVAYDKTLDLSSVSRAKIAFEQGRYYYTDQQWDEALKSYRQALDFYRKAEDAAGQAGVYVGMADVQRFRPDRDLETALDYYNRAYTLYLGMDVKGVSNLLSQAQRLYEIGEVLRLQQHLEAALESYSKALAIFQGFGYDRDMAFVHRSMAAALAQLSPNQKEAAIEHYKQALALLPGESDPAGRAEMCRAMGDLLCERQDWIAALQAYEQGLHFYQQDNNPAGQAALYWNLGEIEQARGKGDAALAHYAASLELYKRRYEELEDRSKENTDYVTVQAGKADAYWAIGRIKQQRREWGIALQNYESAIDLYREIKDEAKRRAVEKGINETAHNIKWMVILYESDRPCRDHDHDLVNAFIEYEKRGDHRGTAHVCQKIGEELQSHGEDITLVLEAHQYARWYYGEAWDERGRAYTAQQIAEIERSLGDLQTAQIDYDIALQAYSKVGDERGMAYVCQRMGEVELLCKDPKQSLKFLGSAVALYQHTGDKAGEAYVQKARGEIEQGRRHWEEARKCYQRAMALYQDLSDRAGEAYARKVLGEVEQADTQWSMAQQQFEASLNLYHEMGDHLAEAYLRRVIGDIQQARQRPGEALESYNQTLNFYEREKIQLPAEQARIYRARGDLWRKSGKLDEALHDYQQSAQLYETLKDSSGAAAVYRAMLEIQQTRREPTDLDAAQDNARKILDTERIAGYQRAATAASPVADARVNLEQGELAFVNRTYTLQVCLAQRQLEELHDGMSTLQNPLLVAKTVISVDLDIDGPVTYQRRSKQLCYDPNEMQCIDFPFEVKAVGRHTLSVTFHNKRWLGTISFSFDAVEPLSTSVISAPTKWVGLEPLTLPLHDEYQVALFLCISQKGNTYTIQIISDRGASKAFPMAITEHDVSDMNRRLQTAIENVSLATSGDGNLDEALYKLKMEGRYAWEQIFNDESVQDLVQDALKPGATIQIVADPLDKFSIPWELLYDEAQIGKVEAPPFWGMLYHIVRSLQFKKEWPPESIRVIMPNIGFIRDKELAAAEEEWKELNTWTNIHCDLLDDLNEGKHPVEVNTLFRFLSDKKLHILHFACDAKTEDSGDLYMQISDEFQIRLQEFDSKFQIAHHPLVILNACKTGENDPLRTSNWVTFFWERGASGVVATEARILDEFAARFSKKLYELLLTGEKIGTVLFEARHYFWKEEHDLSGLVYALYASPSLRIEIQKPVKEEL